MGAIDQKIVPSPSKKAVQTAEGYVATEHTFIIVAAIEAKVDFVATFERQPVIDPPQVNMKSGLNIETPLAQS